MAFTQLVSLFRPKVNKIATKSGKQDTKSPAGDTPPFAVNTQLCAGQESEIKTRLWAFTWRRRVGGARLAGANWFHRLSSGEFLPREKEKKQTPTKGCQKWNAIVLIQTNEQALAGYYWENERPKIQFLLLLLQNIHQLDIVHFCVGIGGGGGSKATIFRVETASRLRGTGGMWLQSIWARLECSDIHTFAAAKFCREYPSWVVNSQKHKIDTQYPVDWWHALYIDEVAKRPDKLIHKHTPLSCTEFRFAVMIAVYYNVTLRYLIVSVATMIEQRYWV